MSDTSPPRIRSGRPSRTPTPLTPDPPPSLFPRPDDPGRDSIGAAPPTGTAPGTAPAGGAGAGREPGADAPLLVRALDRVARRHPLDRKLLLAPSRGSGRELLRTLARARGGWTGFAVETPRPLALHLATGALARRGLRVLDELEEEALVDEAVDAAVAGPGPARRFADLAGGPGFRKAARSALRALRLARVGPGRLRQAPFRDTPKQDLLARALAALEAAMEERSAVDVAAVLALATEALREGAPLPAPRVYLLPGLAARGAAGSFVQALLARGAAILPTEPVRGAEPPEGMVFRAGGTPSPRSFLLAPGALPEPRPAGTSADPAGDPGDATSSGAGVRDLPLFRTASPAGSGDPAPSAGGSPAGDPDLHLFAAGGIQEELREVLRRVMASGRPFDDVEIVTPDPGVYGPALHAVASQLGVGVTFAVGLPVERTRPGRAVAAWLRWLRDDFPSPELRRLLENDDLRAPAPHHGVGSRRLAHRLRRLRVGWGRERYETRVDAALRRLDRSPPTPRRDESPEELAERTARIREELEALRALMRHLLRATPDAVPRRVELRPRPVAPAELARSLSALLDLVPTRPGSVDGTARERLLRILDRMRATLTRPVPFGSALGSLEDHLAIRVPAPRAEGKAPWLSDGGSLHLSDVEHGGLTGRSLTFVVGMDADRFPGGDVQDPLLLDRERTLLSAALPTARQRTRDRQFRFAALLARLPGEVTLSYPAWDAAEARVLSPSPVLLQAYRLATGDPAAGFEDLRTHLGTPASRIPRGEGLADGEDVWLRALTRGGHLLEGTDAVRATFPRLHAGLRALRAWDPDTEPGPHHGLLPPRPSFDPRENTATVLSASRLETLGACPLRYFHRYVLGVKAPEDPEFRPDAWLDALHRGSLLHRVFERLLEEAREEAVQPGEERFLELGRQVLEDEARRRRHEIPPPSEAVFGRELVALEDDLRCFAAHLERHPPSWERLELSFGFEGEPPVALEIGGGTVRLRGAVDRVDRVPAAGPEEGSPLRIVDYKTGSFGSHWARSTGTFHGGRRLQHLLYTLAVETLEEERVAAMEYHFPTRKGEGGIRRFHRRELEDGRAVVASLLEAVRQGRFLPTETKDDCRFCDYKAVCRIRETDWGIGDAPPADWGQARMEEDAEVYRELARVRRWEG